MLQFDPSTDECFAFNVSSKLNSNAVISTLHKKNKCLCPAFWSSLLRPGSYSTDVTKQKSIISNPGQKFRHVVKRGHLSDPEASQTFQPKKQVCAIFFRLERSTIVLRRWKSEVRSEWSRLFPNSEFMVEGIQSNFFFLSSAAAAADLDNEQFVSRMPIKAAFHLDCETILCWLLSIWAANLVSILC